VVQLFDHPLLEGHDSRIAPGAPEELVSLYDTGYRLVFPGAPKEMDLSFSGSFSFAIAAIRPVDVEAAESGASIGRRTAATAYKVSPGVGAASTESGNDAGAQCWKRLQFKLDVRGRHGVSAD
jgi:hypothetical protein